MLVSPFTFYRGAPAVMAYDLAHTPSSGIIVQLCGDCHISNFGMFASPERDLVFDLNDFDETLPGPFEWDVKRTAASIVVAARNAGLSGKDEGDPLFLQIKQANASLLEPYLGRSQYDRPGQRVVTGQRLMQATNDIFLGYSRSAGDDYFVRQLYDMKGSASLERIPALYLQRYAGLCGAVLARAHARTGDAAQIAGYLGKSDAFDKALVEFAFSYAVQNETDYAAFRQAVQDGRLEAKTEAAANKKKRH